jgi:hypothetical protein
MSARWLAGWLIGVACRFLPEPYRAFRYREWTAEAAAILDDQGTRSRVRRNARVLVFAADQIRGARALARHAGMPLARPRSLDDRLIPPLAPRLPPAVRRRSQRSAYVPLSVALGMQFAFHALPFWSSVADPARVAGWELCMWAGLMYWIARERRYNLTIGETEFNVVRVWRYWSLSMWGMAICVGVVPVFASSVFTLTLVAAEAIYLSAVWLFMLRVERWVFRRPDPAANRSPRQDPV